MNKKLCKKLLQNSMEIGGNNGTCLANLWSWGSRRCKVKLYDFQWQSSHIIMMSAFNKLHESIRVHCIIKRKLFLRTKRLLKHLIAIIHGKKSLLKLEQLMAKTAKTYKTFSRFLFLQFCIMAAYFPVLAWFIIRKLL